MKLFTLIVGLFIIFSAAAQNTPAKPTYNRWSIGLNVGGNDGMSYTNPNKKLYQISYYDGHIRYMFNNRFGLKFETAFDNFKTGANNTNKIRFSVAPTVNLTDVLHFSDFSKRFGLLAYVGVGYSSMWNKEFSSVAPTELLQMKIGSVDEMGQVFLGLTPQFKVNERFSLNADFVVTANTMQNNNFDFTSPTPSTLGSYTGYMWNWSVGGTYYIGKNKTHADWTSTPRMNIAELNRIAQLEQQLKALEQKNKDDDKDGVPNGQDLEPNTPEGTPVDFTGKAIAPTAAPDLNTMDTDGDGVVDAADYCPTVRGQYNGCPEEVHAGGTQADRDAKFLAELGIRDVLFVSGSAYLNPVYHPVLDQLIEFMKQNPDVKIELSGHADINGSDDINLRLSEARVKNCLNYLVNKGVDRTRLTVTYKGAKEVKYQGVTQEIHASNRRVSFSIVH